MGIHSLDLGFYFVHLNFLRKVGCPEVGWEGGSFDWRTRGELMFRFERDNCGYDAQTRGEPMFHRWGKSESKGKKRKYEA